MVKYGYINLTGKRIYMATRKKGDESMIKKFLSILLAVCMLACFVPMDAYAIVGSVRSETEEVTNNKGTYRNYNVTWIENDHIRLYFCAEFENKFWRWLSGNCACKNKSICKRGI